MSIATLDLNASNFDAAHALRECGCALLTPQQLHDATAVQLPALNELRASWDRLPRDTYLLDGGRYRFRRHSCFIQELPGDSLQLVPHRAHWQPRDYNALHGGLERWFEPIETAVLNAPAWGALVRGLGKLFAAVRTVPRWYIE